MPCFSSCPRSPTPLNISSCRPLSISSCRLPSVPVWSRAPMGAPGEGSAASGRMGREGSSYGLRVAAAAARRRLRSPPLRVPARPSSPLVAALTRRCLPPAPLSNAPPACLSAVGTRSHAHPPLPVLPASQPPTPLSTAATPAALPPRRLLQLSPPRQENGKEKRMMLTTGPLLFPSHLLQLGKQQRSDDGGSTRSVGNCDGGSSCGGSDGGCSVLRWRQWLEVAPRGDGRKAARRGLETTVTSRPRGDDGGLTRLGCEQATGRSCLSHTTSTSFLRRAPDKQAAAPHEEATTVAPLEEEATVARHGKEVTVGARLRQQLRVRRRQRQRLVGIRQTRRRTGKTADRRLPAATGLMMPTADQLGDKK
uniref:Uncharacterized protein n=1 Tax=Oryza sativa subsp. japonica TaxID=39947 RepID=Q75I07_ORYSJ|nr:hypothetical protein [Oryza sativa Japonica Group]AAS07289.1 hypothetical protein [Oryza sativa Japonica Group]